MNKSILKNKQGFSLIEVLVVVVIIVVLSSIVLVAVVTIQTKSRDKERIVDLAQVKLALARYHNENGTYPESTTYDFAVDLVPLVTGNYLPSLPQDPRDGEGNLGYHYTYFDTEDEYCLAATFESAKNKPLDDDDCDPDYLEVEEFYDIDSSNDSKGTLSN